MTRFYTLLSCLLLLVPNSSAFNLRKAALRNGGGVINSVFQDKDGLIWIGTNSGLNTYDGKDVISLNGYKGIQKIDGSPKGDVFVETLYGLYVINTASNTRTAFEMFNNVSFSAVDSKSTSFIIQGNGFVYYKPHLQENYDNVIIPELIATKIKIFFVDDNDILRILTDDGCLRSFEISYNNELVYLKEKPEVRLSSNVSFCFTDEDTIFFIDEEYIFYKFDIKNNSTSYISNVKSLLADKGKITAGVVFKNEFYFGTESGLFQIINNHVKQIPIKGGVSSIVKDRFQDLIWINTLGDGLYTYSFEPYFIKSYLFSDLCPEMLRPSTAICLDNQGALWIGTEGTGVVLLPDYSLDKEINVVKKISKNNGLPDNNIYSFHESRQGLWIGCQSGLAFYSYKNKNISVLHNVLATDIRAIYEQDSTLWLACYEKGIVKTSVEYKDGVPQIRHIQLYSASNQDDASNRFSSIYANREKMLFTNTGNGVFEMKDDKLKKVKLTDKRLKATNQITSINEFDYMAATDFGCFRFSLNDDSINNISILNDITSKDILSGNWGDYWLSTDNGLIIYNLKKNSIQSIDYSYGFPVFEYNNGASFKDIKNNKLFFGGINGFTAIQYNDYDEAMDYMPRLSLERLSLFGINKSINDFRKKGSDRLIFKSDENVFSLSFRALDYVNGNNYIYYYKIGNGPWVNNENSGTISFTDISPGTYDLYIKYYNKMLNKESYAQSISIKVLPPWYKSVYAYIVYFLLGLLLVYLFVYVLSKRRKKAKKEEIAQAEQRRKEDIYEAKLDFFIDIAHEFCTPLTLISGPCNLILNQKNISPSVQKYADIIKRNAKRMNSLISDLMEFKRMEIGYKLPEITELNVSAVANRVIGAFKINVQGHNIRIEKRYAVDLNWNTDEKFLTTILINLISNAVKYSNDDAVLVEMNVENESLILKVTNKGKGIVKEDMDRIFNRFLISSNEKQRGWKQNGLGLTVTGSMVKLLSGSISVISIPDEYTTFVVNLPFLEIKSKTSRNTDFNEGLDDVIIPEFGILQPKYTYKDGRFTVAIIDDDPEMLWLICDILSDEFNVLPVRNSSKAVDILTQKHSDIILCDMMMDDIDGIKLAKILKADKITSHIPLIIVSAAHDIEIQTEALNAGAEIYITKPFDPKHLKTTIKRLLGRKEDLKDYFNSPLSAYELDMGKLQHTEHRKFLKKMYGIISKNIQNKELSPDFIASELGMSLRTLYRKLKEATDKGLLEIIREGKLVEAENLLLKSKFTIDEIVFKSGFSSRASFYRAFTNKYGCTPTEFVEKNRLKNTYESNIRLSF